MNTSFNLAFPFTKPGNTSLNTMLEYPDEYDLSIVRIKWSVFVIGSSASYIETS